ncbi:hypothetical protein C7974DRAFT_456841 [Boeremia exigua]|uniref:uncharacterized protein n=1 Tax=Boeremia exigua TaxID=749465 RepID=UPI001E8DB1A8|nr:uncharacterized protein C7974DRAFT_456841 [Boeremia exigua]KAH6621982.1 hypothetical protein C7974DRAFT_456841 [Boeremia exigua]
MNEPSMPQTCAATWQLDDDAAGRLSELEVCSWEEGFEVIEDFYGPSSTSVTEEQNAIITDTSYIGESLSIAQPLEECSTAGIATEQELASEEATKCQVHAAEQHTPHGVDLEHSSDLSTSNRQASGLCEALVTEPVSDVLETQASTPTTREVQVAPAEERELTAPAPWSIDIFDIIDFSPEKPLPVAHLPREPDAEGSDGYVQGSSAVGPPTPALTHSDIHLPSAKSCVGTEGIASNGDLAPFAVHEHTYATPASDSEFGDFVNLTSPAKPADAAIESAADFTAKAADDKNCLASPSQPASLPDERAVSDTGMSLDIRNSGNGHLETALTASEEMHEGLGEPSLEIPCRQITESPPTILEDQSVSPTITQDAMRENAETETPITFLDHKLGEFHREIVEYASRCGLDAHDQALSHDESTPCDDRPGPVTGDAPQHSLIVPLVAIPDRMSTDSIIPTYGTPSMAPDQCNTAGYGDFQMPKQQFQVRDIVMNDVDSDFCPSESSSQPGLSPNIGPAEPSSDVGQFASTLLSTMSLYKRDLLPSTPHEVLKRPLDSAESDKCEEPDSKRQRIDSSIDTEVIEAPTFEESKDLFIKEDASISAAKYEMESEPTLESVTIGHNPLGEQEDVNGKEDAPTHGARVEPENDLIVEPEAIEAATVDELEDVDMEDAPPIPTTQLETANSPLIEPEAIGAAHLDDIAGDHTSLHTEDAPVSAVYLEAESLQVANVASPSDKLEGIHTEASVPVSAAQLEISIDATVEPVVAEAAPIPEVADSTSLSDEDPSASATKNEMESDATAGPMESKAALLDDVAGVKEGTLVAAARRKVDNALMLESQDIKATSFDEAVGDHMSDRDEIVPVAATQPEIESTETVQPKKTEATPVDEAVDVHMSDCDEHVLVSATQRAIKSEGKDQVTSDGTVIPAARAAESAARPVPQADNVVEVVQEASQVSSTAEPETHPSALRSQNLPKPFGGPYMQITDVEMQELITTASVSPTPPPPAAPPRGPRLRFKPLTPPTPLDEAEAEDESESEEEFESEGGSESGEESESEEVEDAITEEHVATEDELTDAEEEHADTDDKPRPVKHEPDLKKAKLQDEPTSTEAEPGSTDVEPDNEDRDSTTSSSLSPAPSLSLTTASPPPTPQAPEPAAPAPPADAPFRHEAEFHYERRATRSETRSSGSSAPAATHVNQIDAPAPPAVKEEDVAGGEERQSGRPPVKKNRVAAARASAARARAAKVAMKKAGPQTLSVSKASKASKAAKSLKPSTKTPALPASNVATRTRARTATPSAPASASVSTPAAVPAPQPPTSKTARKTPLTATHTRTRRHTPAQNGVPPTPAQPATQTPGSQTPGSQAPGSQPATAQSAPSQVLGKRKTRRVSALEEQMRVVDEREGRLRRRAGGK